MLSFKMAIKLFLPTPSEYSNFGLKPVALGLYKCLNDLIIALNNISSLPDHLTSSEAF